MVDAAIGRNVNNTAACRQTCQLVSLLVCELNKGQVPLLLFRDAEFAVPFLELVNLRLHLPAAVQRDFAAGGKGSERKAKHSQEDQKFAFARHIILQRLLMH